MTAKFDNLCISTWNVKFLGHPVKRKKIFSILKSKQFDAEESEELCRDGVSPWEESL